MGVRVYYPKPPVGETAPFGARPLSKSKFEHGSRRISRPPITMGVVSFSHDLSLMVLITETR